MSGSGAVGVVNRPEVVAPSAGVGAAVYNFFSGLFTSGHLNMAVGLIAGVATALAAFRRYRIDGRKERDRVSQEADGEC